MMKASEQSSALEINCLTNVQPVTFIMIQTVKGTNQKVENYTSMLIFIFLWQSIRLLIERSKHKTNEDRELM
jgi:hypothetical protein